MFSNKHKCINEVKILIHCLPYFYNFARNQSTIYFISAQYSVLKHSSKTFYFFDGN